MRWTSSRRSRLAQLHAQGALDDEEFARAKARVLGEG
ncbi:MAG: SHOCT domain-containing protein [Solirubrobacteraceae bacterium]